MYPVEIMGGQSLGEGQDEMSAYSLKFLKYKRRFLETCF